MAFLEALHAQPIPATIATTATFLFMPTEPHAVGNDARAGARQNRSVFDELLSYRVTVEETAADRSSPATIATSATLFNCGASVTNCFYTD